MKREYLVFKDLEESGLLARHNNLECQVIETPALTRSKRRGYLYVLCGYFPGYCYPVKKIGISDNPISRYTAICRRCPYPIFIDYLFYTPFYAVIESHLHKKFKANRVRNDFCPSGGTEWFVGVGDENILAHAIETDFSQKPKREGRSNSKLFDYSENFRPDIESYFSGQVNYSSLTNGIKIENRSEEVPVLIKSMEYLY